MKKNEMNRAVSKTWYTFITKLCYHHIFKRYYMELKEYLQWYCILNRSCKQAYAILVTITYQQVECKIPLGHSKPTSQDQLTKPWLKKARRKDIKSSTNTELKKWRLNPGPFQVFLKGYKQILLHQWLQPCNLRINAFPLGIHVLMASL